MKSDLDALMLAQNIDALIVFGAGDHNPAMVYLTGGGHLTNAELVIRRGHKGVLFHGAMEREEAARTGMETRSFSQYPIADYLAEAGGDREKADVLRHKKMYTDAGLSSGRVAIYGMTELGFYYSLLTKLEKEMPGLEIIGYLEEDILLHAMASKSPDEIARIREMGKITTRVVGRTADYMTGHKVKNGMLVKANGDPLTIGEVKGMINLWLAEAGAENPEGTIFAIGRDAGVPHSTGTASDPLRLGQTIVYDIFPCEAQGGYFYDFTRTWCLGYAPDDVLKLYDDVHSVYTQIISELKVGTPFSDYQSRVCDLYEAQGHPTIKTNPATENGYVHSLGHGIGLRVHERPTAGMKSPVLDLLKPGSVITIEPGLYYPEKGMGVRLEDSLVVRNDGQFEILAPYPLDLVLPVKG